MQITLQGTPGVDTNSVLHGSNGSAHVQTEGYDSVEGVTKVANLIWDTGTLAWIKDTGTGGGGGGGDATAANQVTGNTSLGSIDTKTPALGQALMAASTPVVIASNQPAVPTSLSTLPALVAGTAIIGKVGIDQTTPGTTNGVQVNAALPAGTNAIGKLAANSGVDIGDVDVTSLPALVAGAAIIGKVGIDQTTPGTTNKVDIGTNGQVAATQSGVWTVSANPTDYTTAVDEVSSTVTYLGKAAIASATASAVWKIQKVTVTATVTRILYADGNASFDNVWDNRASLSYS